MIAVREYETEFQARHVQALSVWTKEIRYKPVPAAGYTGEIRAG